MEKVFFTRVQRMLKKYELPGIDSLYNMDISEDQWKINTKRAVRKYWTEGLRLEAYEKSTLKYCNISCLQIGRTHHVWDYRIYKAGSSACCCKKSYCNWDLYSTVTTLKI